MDVAFLKVVNFDALTNHFGLEWYSIKVPT